LLLLLLLAASTSMSAIMLSSVWPKVTCV